MSDDKRPLKYDVREHAWRTEMVNEMASRKDAVPAEDPITKATNDAAYRSQNAWRGDAWLAANPRKADARSQAQIEAAAAEAARAAKPGEVQAGVPQGSGLPATRPNLEAAWKEYIWRSRNMWKGDKWIADNEISKPWLKDE